MTEPSRLVRQLARGARTATLATLGPDGHPFASLVLVACTMAGAPILLISRLAEHTANLTADPRASLLVQDPAAAADPMAGARATLVGRFTTGDAAAVRDRFLARHAEAEAYAGFGDFAFWTMQPAWARLVAGFGRIARVEAPLYDGATTDLAAAEADIVAHMNADHADAVALYATGLLGRPGGAWRMTGCDPEGCDLRLGADYARLEFEGPVADAEQARRELVAAVRRARQRGAGASG